MTNNYKTTTNRKFELSWYLSLFIALIFGLTALYNLTGCRCGEPEELKKEMKVVMESYIDSAEDDFSTYQFETIYLDTMFLSDLLYREFADKGEFSLTSLRDEYKSKYEHQLEINRIIGQMDAIYDMADLYKQSYLRYDSMYNKNRKDWDYLKMHTEGDSIQFIKLRLHYKISNKFNARVKKTCSFSIRRGKVLSRHIEDGFVQRDSIIGMGKKHLLENTSGN
jgi:hypothetical protein